MVSLSRLESVSGSAPRSVVLFSVAVGVALMAAAGEARAGTVVPTDGMVITEDTTFEPGTRLCNRRCATITKSPARRSMSWWPLWMLLRVFSALAWSAAAAEGWCWRWSAAMPLPICRATWKAAWGGNAHHPACWHYALPMGRNA